MRPCAGESVVLRGGLTHARFASVRIVAGDNATRRPVAGRDLDEKLGSPSDAAPARPDVKDRSPPSLAGASSSRPCLRLATRAFGSFALSRLQILVAHPSSRGGGARLYSGNKSFSLPLYPTLARFPHSRPPTDAPRTVLRLIPLTALAAHVHRISHSCLPPREEARDSCQRVHGRGSGSTAVEEGRVGRRRVSSRRRVRGASATRLIVDVAGAYEG